MFHLMAMNDEPLYLHARDSVWRQILNTCVKYDLRVNSNKHSSARDFDNVFNTGGNCTRILNQSDMNDGNRSL
jgi:hypothetical protein